MADDLIIRDFTEERLHLVLAELSCMRGMHPPEGYTYESKDFFQTATVVGMEEATKTAEKEALENFWKCDTIDFNTSEDVKKIWEKVSEIDQRYASQFRSLEGYMNTYWSCVSDISNMVSKGAQERGNGIFSPTQEFNNTIEGIRNRINTAKENFDNVRIEEALKKAGYTEDEIPDIKKKLDSFADTYEYTYEQKLALAKNVSTSDDRLQFVLFLDGKFDEVFAMNPNGISAGMMQNLSDFATNLLLTGKEKELEIYLNSVTEGVFKDGLPLEKYSLEYLTAMEQAMEYQYMLYSNYLREQMGIDENGNVYFLDEPAGNAEECEKIAANLRKMDNLVQYYQIAQLLSTDYYSVTKDYRQKTDKEFNTNGSTFGFTVNFGEGGFYKIPLTLSYEYQICVTKQNLTGDNTNSLKDHTYILNYASSSKETSAGEIAEGFARENLEKVAQAKKAAQDKLAISAVTSLASLLGNMIPGGSIAEKAIKNMIPIAQNAIKGMASSVNPADYAKNLADGYKGMASSESSKTNAGYASSMAGFASSIFAYYETVGKLDAEALKYNQFRQELWFGSRTNYSLYGGGNDKNLSTSFPYTDYRALYGQKLWLENGIAQYATGYNKDAAYSFKNPNSIINNYLKHNANKIIDYIPLSESEIVDEINKLSDVERLALFGSDPNKLLGRNDIKAPNITFDDIRTSEQIEDFQRVIDRTKNGNGESDSIMDEFKNQIYG